MNHELFLVLGVYAIFCICGGIFSLLVRRNAFGLLVSQAVCLKGIIFSCVALSGYGGKHSDDLLVLGLVASAILFVSILVGFGTMMRAKRFDGSLDTESEARLRN